MTTMSSKTTGYKLTKADFQQINRRNLVGFQAGWNYERMQHSGYLWIILPQLRKIYGDDTEALKTACRTQCSPFFNTSNFLNTIITGIDLAIEETDGLEGMDTVASLKTGLMGPLASIGDSIFGSLLPTIFGALAANMAMQGNPLGIFIWIAVNVVVDWFRCKQTYIAYDQGIKLVTTMSDKLNAITDAATVMGVFMVGALISTNVGIVLTITPDIGGVVIDVQDILNNICPKLVPAALVGFVYWLLGRKGMTSTKAIFIVLVIGIVLGALELVAKG
ncbi:PTS system mannose/fructose/sorbose family transporter subunit IID [Olsenella sp. An188]|uniref:PTS system mannose/fructose/sorbose family transporter subunit IID n=1 Tax=Olsenella sp. An188 TaxID=1965579 RepID=UPI000B39D162|nr:PTS system mannose/fructose/sorbose family transporter subunit IID [Olsenella sp. An188]OUP38746.1 PTS fructose transporter subunit IID [Olsenella sp. An188]HBO61600.1 PTS fructose transporter subunit IID [Olsenella sp.]HJB55150.1 PTS system mannose/fructose/sorbose family transporter subunit IID [Candidatus Olsenella avistercoris]